MEYYKSHGLTLGTVAGTAVLAFLWIFLASMSSKAQTDFNDFPLHEYYSANHNKTLFVYLSGDGGMNEFSKSLCGKLMEKGYPVIALDSKKYFWKPKDPQQFTIDLDQMIRHYQQLWHTDSFVILGYSFGADVGVFVPQRLPLAINEKLKLAVYLNPSATTDYEIKVMDMLGKNSDNRKYNIVTEMNAINTAPVLCLMSEDEETISKGMIHNQRVLTKTLPGDHRFNYDYDLILRTIFAQL